MLILVMMLHEHAIATNFESLFFALTVTGIVTKIVTNRKKERKKNRRWALIIINESSENPQVLLASQRNFGELLYHWIFELNHLFCNIFNGFD